MCFSACCNPNVVSLRTSHWKVLTWTYDLTFSLIEPLQLIPNTIPHILPGIFLGWKTLPALVACQAGNILFCDLFKRRLGFCVAWWECQIPYGATPLCQMWDGVKIWTQRPRPGKKQPDFVLLPFWFWDRSPKSGSSAESKAMHPGRNWSKPTAELNIDSGVHPSENTRTGAMRKRQAVSWPECWGCHQHVCIYACSFWSFYQIH